LRRRSGRPTTDIKNNLQAITDLLALELEMSDRSDSGESLRQSIERIQAIALVHDLLSHDSEMEYVDVGRLTERLVPTVLRTNARSPAEVELALSLLPVSLPSKKATALALVLNELISNAAKHAFAGRANGRLQVQLTREADRHRLVVQDDGPGLPPDFDVETHANVGMQVVRTLVEGSLGGRLILRSENGLRAEILFPSDPRDRAAGSPARELPRT
jgi:two-component sensor histidine kinase